MPKAVWILGLVSIFMDISSEIVHGLLPVIPGLIAVLLVVLGVREPEHKAAVKNGLTFKGLRQFGPAFWLVLAFCAAEFVKIALGGASFPRGSGCLAGAY
jgi:hypothetical protein